MNIPSLPSIERRFTQGIVECRALGDSKKPVIAGYAAKFSSRSENMGWGDVKFFEVIERGFFNKVLGDDVRILKNHDANLILGRTASGTARIAQDDTGLSYECDPDEEQTYARDLLISLRRKDITQSSFAFSVTRAGQRFVEEGNTITRYLLADGCSRLSDCSPVSYPAYPSATSEARSLIEMVEEARREGMIGKDAAEALAHAAARRARELQLAELES
jgi:HK97 family phage prohead protease